MLSQAQVFIFDLSCANIGIICFFKIMFFDKNNLLTPNSINGKKYFFIKK